MSNPGFLLRSASSFRAASFFQSSYGHPSSPVADPFFAEWMAFPTCSGVMSQLSMVVGRFGSLWESGISSSVLWHILAYSGESAVIARPSVWMLLC